MMIIIGMLSEKLFFFGLFTQAEASITTKIGNNYTVRGGFGIRKVYGCHQPSLLTLLRIDLLIWMTLS